jgi:hypothetical protein
MRGVEGEDGGGLAAEDATPFVLCPLALRCEHDSLARAPTVASSYHHIRAGREFCAKVLFVLVFTVFSWDTWGSSCLRLSVRQNLTMKFFLVCTVDCGGDEWTWMDQAW